MTAMTAQERNAVDPAKYDEAMRRCTAHSGVVYAPCDTCLRTTVTGRRYRVRADEIVAGDTYVEKASRLNPAFEARVTLVTRTEYTNPRGTRIPRVVIHIEGFGGAFTCAPHSRHDIRRAV